MEINVRDDRRIVEIWLTNEEQQDQALQESLTPIYQQCKAAKYTAAVFLSGSRELAEEAGSSKAVNIVLLGRISKWFDFTEQDWLEAIEQSVPPKFLELNRKAFMLGRNA